MIKFFRKIRQKLLVENRFGKYLLYALGEIILVVIGILIALQINNWNETIKVRATEMVYLKNIKNDLQLTIAEIDKFIELRNTLIQSAKRTLEHFEGKPISDPEAFNKDIVDIYTWERFYQVNNTFQELTSSGNLSLIEDEKIKNGLLNIESLYKKIKYNEDHFRYDTEVTMYAPSYKILDINTMGINYFYQATNGQIGAKADLEKEDFEPMLTDHNQKNGFALTWIEFTKMNMALMTMKEECKNLILLIDNDLNN